MRRIVEWYLRLYHGRPADLGGPAMFCDRSRMGAFASTPREFSAGTATAIFKVIVASTVFQRRQDQQVFRILRGIAPDIVNRMVSARTLKRDAAATRCECLRDLDVLHARCDIAKVTGRVTCRLHATLACPPKMHASLLRRYADFGKVPTSAALLLVRRGAASFGQLYRTLLASPLDAAERATALETEVTAVWRVSAKIGALILSALSNPDLGGPPPPWTAGLDWRRWIVVDSNVDKFLAYLGDSPTQSYEERRERLRALARAVRLDQLKPQLARYNPRLVQQAIYMFMSVSNRNASAVDCVRRAPDACRGCDRALRTACPVRPT